MVSLTMMARLLEAVRPDARLVLVGDPDQLSSVDAGAVLTDLVRRLRGPPRLTGRGAAYDPPLRRRDRVRWPRRSGWATPTPRWRCCAAGHERGRVGDRRRPGLADPQHRTACGPARSATPRWPGTMTRALAALDRHRLLCAHRDGPYGVRHWNRRIEQWLAAETGDPLHERDYLGRPLLVTANDHAPAASTTATPASWWRCPTAGAGSRSPAREPSRSTSPPSRLGDVETMHAMTIHKSQGSQADVVTVLLPDVESRLLTRELFYTAVTRAQRPRAGRRSGARGPGRDRAAGPARERAAGASGRVVTARSTGSGTAAHAAVRETPAQRVPASLGPCRSCCASPCPTSRDRWVGVASAIGEAGGDIEAIEIVEKGVDGRAVDDVLLEIGARHDARLDRLGVQRPRRRRGALDQPVRRRRQPLPRPRGRRGADRPPRPGARPAASTCCRSPSASTGRSRIAPPTARRPGHRRRARARSAGSGSSEPTRLEGDDDVTLAVRRPHRRRRDRAIGRRGGPEFLDSELARLGHLPGLAQPSPRLTRSDAGPVRARGSAAAGGVRPPTLGQSVGTHSSGSTRGRIHDERRVRRARAGTAGSRARSSSGTPRSRPGRRPRAPTSRHAPSPVGIPDAVGARLGTVLEVDLGVGAKVVAHAGCVGAPPLEATAGRRRRARRA